MSVWASVDCDEVKFNNENFRTYFTHLNEQKMVPCKSSVLEKSQGYYWWNSAPSFLSVFLLGWNSRKNFFQMYLNILFWWTSPVKEACMAADNRVCCPYLRPHLLKGKRSKIWSWSWIRNVQKEIVSALHHQKFTLPFLRLREWGILGIQLGTAQRYARPVNVRLEVSYCVWTTALLNLPLAHWLIAMYCESNMMYYLRPPWGTLSIPVLNPFKMAQISADIHFFFNILSCVMTSNILL